MLVYSVATVPKEPGSSPPLLSEATRIGALQRLRLRPGLAMGLASHGLLVDQVTAAREVFPGAELTVLLGSDKALQLLDPRWYVDRDDALDRLLGAADVRYVERAGSEGLVAAALARPEHRRWAAGFTRLPSGPFADISSAQVRARLRRGEDVGAWVPRGDPHTPAGPALRPEETALEPAARQRAELGADLLGIPRAPHRSTIRPSAPSGRARAREGHRCEGASPPPPG